MKLITTLLFAVLLAGCASVGTPIDVSATSQLVKGKSTEADAIRIFGPPSHKTLNSEGNVMMMWIHTTASAKPESFIPIVGAFAGGTDVRQQTLTILVGKDGRIVNWTSNDSRQDVGIGGSAVRPKP